MKPKLDDIAPDFTAPCIQGVDESNITLSKLRGETVVLVFYPKDNTPGCTVQACSLRDHWNVLAKKARIFGISADSISSHKKFITKQELPYSLIADEDQKISEAYGVWVQKSMMGKTFMGIERTTFIISPQGKIQAVLEKVSPAKHIDQLIHLIG